MSSMVETKMLDKLERVLDIATKRQQLITSNMANVDTPRYRTQDIDFQAELKKAVRANHPGSHEPMAKDVQGLVERPDGNNVDMDRESMQLAETQLQFKTSIELMRDELKRISMAIHDGRTS